MTHEPAPPAPSPEEDRIRQRITLVFRLFEDVIFVGLGLLLAGCALYLLLAAGLQFLQRMIEMSMTVAYVVNLTESLLLILLVLEILYTVQVSFRKHTLAPEPFLLIGLIAAVRRVLVITAELAEVQMQSEEVFRHRMIELGLMTVLILSLVASVSMLRRKGVTSEA